MLSLAVWKVSYKQPCRSLSKSFSMNFSSRRFSMFCSRPCTRAKETWRAQVAVGTTWNNSHSQNPTLQNN